MTGCTHRATPTAAARVRLLLASAFATQMEMASLATRTRRNVALMLCLLPLVSTAGCGGGGGGGGGGSATVTGRVLLVSTAQPPDPVATVTIGGRSTTTALDGTFLLQNVSASATTATVAAAGQQTLTQPLPALASGSATDIGEVYLSEDGYTSSVSGRVARADTLAAIAGADIRIDGRRTTSAADGSFSMSSLPVGLGRGGAQIGVVHATDFDDKALVLDFELDNGANPIGDVLMAPKVGGIPGGPATVSGKVTLQGQSSASGATVAIVDAGGTEVGIVVTAADGAYGFWVGKGSYTLRFTATGFQLKNVPVTVTRNDVPQTMNVTLVP